MIEEGQKMVPKPLAEIIEDDLLALITNEVREGRSIDYKRELPGNSDGDKKEFLADVSSFANTSGGDLVLGMDEDHGLPTQLTGFQSTNTDAEIQRLDSILASGLSPRIRYAARLIPCNAGLKVLVIRVERSWAGPHRVIFSGHDKFYGRNSAGKYPLDVSELRSAFTLSSTVTERIRAFRTDRIIALSNNETPIPFIDEPKIVLHCIPIESFAGQPTYDILPLYEDPRRLRPMASSSWDRRLNLDGVVVFGGGNPAHTFTQLYRTGIIEAVQGSVLAAEHRGRRMIPSVAYEQYIFQYLPHCFQVLQQIGANVPVVVALSLIGTRGLEMAVDHFDFEASYPIQENMLLLPETIVQDFSMPAGRILKPLFDLVWNACGQPSSKNFDVEGNWVDRNQPQVRR
jgi:hypothetical protein